MTGTFHIVLAMKLTQGNFAENALCFGVAGINVDGCRVNAGEQPKACMAPGWDSINRANAQAGYRPDNYEQGGLKYKPSQLGRFPANVILAHAEGCVLKGTKQVKGRRDESPVEDEGRIDRTQWRFRPTPETSRGYADADGNETVEDWECVESCPIRQLGEQSGKVGAEGTAARFFKQIKEYEHEEDSSS